MMKIIAEHRCFDGTVGFYTHAAETTGCTMRFAVFVPEAQGPLPVVWWLSGLTCTEENFMIKAGAFRAAAQTGLMIVAPDTSPRGEDVPDDPAYDMGQGAGFYVDATEAPWADHFQMYSYITHELPEVIVNAFSADADRQGIMGHSMGGMLMVRFTGTWPQEVGALIVCDSRPVYGEADQERFQRTANRPGREYETQADYIAHFRIRPDGLRSTPEVHQYIAERACKQLPHGTWAHKVDRQTYAHRPMIDTLPLYQQITCPVLYLWAAYSRVTEEMIQGVRDACPQAEIMPVAEAGHHLMLDQPQQTIALVQAFLQRHQLVSETTLA